MSRAVCVAALTAAIAVCAAGCGASKPRSEQRQASEGSCIATVEFKGATYYGNKVSSLLRVGPRIGTGEVPACSDTAQATSKQPTTVPLAGVTDISTAAAVARVDDTTAIYVRRGKCKSARSEAALFACLRRIKP